jgi:cation:H+ antiporter
MTLGWLVLQFAVCAVLIARAGFVLSRSADALAQAHGWGRGWVGLALLATVTSLPELASGISAVAHVGAPNLAVGNVLGACVVNLLLLVLVGVLRRRQAISRDARATHLLSAGFGALMLGFVALSLCTDARAAAVLHVGVYSPLLMALYLFALKVLHGHERRAMAAAARAQAPAAPRCTGGDWRRFGLAAGVVLAAGSWLPVVADGLAQSLGLSSGFAGTVLMAVVTALPEMAVTLGALRLGAPDMAIGNLLGSNLFNLALLAVDDAFYMQGPLLADAAPIHTLTAATALAVTGLVGVGLVRRPLAPSARGRPD